VRSWSKVDVAIFIYDGLCGFCNHAVRWILKRDRFDRFRFAPQQSHWAEQLLLRHGIKREAMIDQNSVYLVLNPDLPQERLLLLSDVTVYALLRLGGAWKFLGRCLQIVPRFARDGGYTLVARNRFRLAGKCAVCPLPPAADREKFLGLTDW
jgi:predicted DCC family thiol-disulfide oxidoreductase YuxK